MEILNKIIDFLTANPFYIDEEEAENKALYEDLNKRVTRLQRYNKHNLIENKIKPFLCEQFFRQNSIYPTEEQLHRMAINAFNQSKDLGYVDCLNNRIGD